MFEGQAGRELCGVSEDGSGKKGVVDESGAEPNGESDGRNGRNKKKRKLYQLGGKTLLLSEEERSIYELTLGRGLYSVEARPAADGATASGAAGKAAAVPAAAATEAGSAAASSADAASEGFSCRVPCPPARLTAASRRASGRRAEATTPCRAVCAHAFSSTSSCCARTILC